MALNENLMVIALETLAFFELAVRDDLVDPAVAEENREGALKELRSMSDEDRNEFAQFALGYADEEEKQGGPEDRIEFFRSVAKEFGGQVS